MGMHGRGGRLCRLCVHAMCWRGASGGHLAALDRIWPIIVGFSRIAGSCAHRLPIKARSACQTRQKHKVGRRALALHTPDTAEEAGDRTASMLKLGAAAWVHTVGYPPGYLACVATIATSFLAHGSPAVSCEVSTRV